MAEYREQIDHAASDHASNTSGSIYRRRMSGQTSIARAREAGSRQGDREHVRARQGSVARMTSSAKRDSRTSRLAPARPAGCLDQSGADAVSPRPEPVDGRPSVRLVHRVAARPRASRPAISTGSAGPWEIPPRRMATLGQAPFGTVEIAGPRRRIDPRPATLCSARRCSTT